MVGFNDDAPLLSPQPGNLPVAPVPLSAQPGEAPAPPRSAVPAASSAGAQRLQPRESPTAGNPMPLEGRLDARASSAYSELHLAPHLASRIGRAEQSNTSILYANQLILKLFRRLESGVNPDVEIGRFLTEAAHFKHIPPFLGEISLTPASAEKTTVAMLQGFVDNRGDGWEWFLGELTGFYANAANRSAASILHAPSFFAEHESLPEELGPARVSLEAAALLGRRTAEMHLALSVTSDPAAFASEPLTAEDQAGIGSH